MNVWRILGPRGRPVVSTCSVRGTGTKEDLESRDPLFCLSHVPFSLYLIMSPTLRHSFTQAIRSTYRVGAVFGTPTLVSRGPLVPSRHTDSYSRSHSLPLPVGPTLTFESHPGPSPHRIESVRVPTPLLLSYSYQ